MRIVLWKCDNHDDFKRQWYMMGDQIPLMCPFCGGLSHEGVRVQQLNNWKKHPLYKWARRKTAASRGE